MISTQQKTNEDKNLTQVFISLYKYCSMYIIMYIYYNTYIGYIYIYIYVIEIVANVKKYRE